MRMQQTQDEKQMARGFFGVEPFRVKRSPAPATKYDIYLFGQIDEAEQFIDAIDALEEAGENDFVVIHLSTNGGSVDATDTFLQYMRECPAKVVVRASGGCHSSGSVILLAADEITVSPGFSCLVHNGSFGVWGKTSDVIRQAAFDARYLCSQLQEVYQDFLTQDEIEDLIGGKDFWLDANDFMARWKRREEIRAQRERDSRATPYSENDDEQDLAPGLTSED
jgi:ATP-dependent protease ClpP protease subunit